MSQVLVVIGWEKFQHYKDRDPPWIKLYRDILTSESWVLGTDDSRLVQIASTLLAARYHNATPLKYDLFRRVANLDLSRVEFDRAITHLEASGFIEIQGVTESASTMLATCTSETEKSREETEKRQMQSASKRASRTCPPDFVVTPEMQAWAEKNCPGIDLHRETESFRDYTFASGKTDWPATWRNWMRKAKPPGRRLTKYEESMNELARRSADGHAATESPLGAFGPDVGTQVPRSVRAIPQRSLEGRAGGDQPGSGEGGTVETYPRRLPVPPDAA